MRKKLKCNLNDSNLREELEDVAPMRENNWKKQGEKDKTLVGKEHSQRDVIEDRQRLCRGKCLKIEKFNGKLQKKTQP